MYRLLRVTVVTHYERHYLVLHNDASNFELCCFYKEIETRKVRIATQGLIAVNSFSCCAISPYTDYL